MFAGNHCLGKGPATRRAAGAAVVAIGALVDAAEVAVAVGATGVLVAVGTTGVLVGVARYSVTHAP